MTSLLVVLLQGDLRSTCITTLLFAWLSYDLKSIAITCFHDTEMTILDNYNDLFLLVRLVIRSMSLV